MRALSLRATLLLVASLATSACDGGPGDRAEAQRAARESPTPQSAPASIALPELTLAACEPSGKGTDYQVGPGRDYTELESVPWELLRPGDTVRIFWRDTPYYGKVLLAAKGTAERPVRVCGVRGPEGQRPQIDGRGAVTRPQLLEEYGSRADVRLIHESRSIVVFKPLVSPSDAWTSYPSFIQLDGLAIGHAHPDYSFVDAAGATRRYTDFGACVWIDRGHDITIADNEISDCQMGIFSKSTDDGDFAVTRNIRIAGNSLWGHGIVGDVHQHTTYLQSVDLVVEFNHYGALRSGASGSSAKDRSVGAVYRYNLIEGGAHAIDLVEAEDFPSTALANAAYRSTFVYGNLITKDGGQGSFIHYGGDHFGSSPGERWGEPIFRKGTLYFSYNTIIATGTEAWLFQLSTTEERAEVWNNVLVFRPTVRQKNLRMDQEVGPGWTGGGVLDLGRNWISSGWQDSDAYHEVGGQVIGTENLIVSANPPIDLATFEPLSGSSILDAAVAGPVAAHDHPPLWQLRIDPSGIRVESRSAVSGASDLGGVERR